MYHKKTIIVSSSLIILLSISIAILIILLNNNCVKFNCNYSDIKFNNITSCKITVHNSTIYKGCTKLYNDCPKNISNCYIYYNNPCPIYNCFDTKIGAIIKTNAFLIILNVIVICCILYNLKKIEVLTA